MVQFVGSNVHSNFFSLKVFKFFKIKLNLNTQTPTRLFTEIL